jgi:hypothetical protein
MGKPSQLWWHTTCTWSALKANSMLSGKLINLSASGISVRSFQNRCLHTMSHSIGYTQAIRTCRCQQSRVQDTTVLPHQAPEYVDVDAPVIASQSPASDVAPIGRVMKEQLALQSRRRATTGQPPHSRLVCGDLMHRQEHINSAVTALKRPKVCHLYGEPAYSKCGLCDVTVHYFSKRGANAGAECYLLYHSDAFFGLAKQDATLVNKRKQDWVFPTNAAKRGSATYIRHLGADQAVNNSNNA